jgi:hypothetical protein
MDESAYLLVVQLLKGGASQLEFCRIDRTKRIASGLPGLITRKSKQDESRAIAGTENG